MTDPKALIAEARREACIAGQLGRPDREDLLRRLAAALEEATTKIEEMENEAWGYACERNLMD